MAAPWKQPALIRRFGGNPGGRNSPLVAGGRVTVSRNADRIEGHDVRTGALLASFPAPGPGTVWEGPNQRLLFSTAARNPFRLIDLGTGKSILEVPGHLGALVRFGNAARIVAIGLAESSGFDGVYFSRYEVDVMDLPSRRMLWVKKGEEDVSGGIAALEVSPDERFAAAIICSTLYIWRLGDGQEIGHWSSSSINDSDLVFFPDGRRLLMNDRRAIRLIDLAGDHPGPVRSISVPSGVYLDTVRVSPDRARLFGGASGRLLLWDLASAAQLWEHPTAGAMFPGIWYISDRILAVSPTRGVLELRDPDNGEIGVSFEAHGDWILSAAATPDGEFLVTADRQEVKVWGLS